MKLSDKQYIVSNGDLGTKLKEAWQQEAIKIMVDRGIYVSVGYDIGNYGRMTRIYFQALDREFDSVHDLYKVLNNKAFI